ncbi:hypothetical protein ACOMHN_056558 [Nucella lapillus]
MLQLLRAAITEKHLPERRPENQDNAPTHESTIAMATVRDWCAGPLGEALAEDCTEQQRVNCRLTPYLPTGLTRG